jgi:hypothetical protein
MQPQPSSHPADVGTRYFFPGVELHVTSPLSTDDLVYPATGFVRLQSGNAALEGSFVRIRSLVTGLAEEAFLDEHGAFAQDVEIQPGTDNALEFAVCDGSGREMARAVAVVRHPSRVLGAAQPLPAQPRQSNRRAILDPPWPRFARLVERCLNLAAEVAGKTGRNPDEFCEHIRVQERYAEQAYEQRDQTLYHECNANLEKYGGYLMQLLGDTLPRPPRPSRSPEEEARSEIDRFRAYLSAVWKQVREKQRSDLEARLSDIAAQARGLSQRAKSDPLTVLRETNRLGTEVEKVADFLHNNRRRAVGNTARDVRSDSSEGGRQD